MRPRSHTAITDAPRPHRTGVIAIVIAVALLLAACGSGPSDATRERDQSPSTTTTTQPPPEGVTFVRIDGGAFRPANLTIELTEVWTVQWQNLDGEEREISATRGEFESGPMAPGDTFEVDFRDFEPGLYRYQMFIGQQRVPGLVDTRPAQ